MLVEPIDNFEFDVDLLINEYLTTVQERMYYFKFGKYWNIGQPSEKFHLIVFNETMELIEQLPYTKKIIENLHKDFDFNMVTYRSVYPNEEYAWHTDRWSDSQFNYHIPLITNELCNFVYLNSSYHMPVGKLYKANIHELHTFRNNGNSVRVHLNFEKFKNKQNT
jgi:hypothetical protein